MDQQTPTQFLPTESSSLLELPTDSKSILAIISCVRCNKVLNPSMYFVCKEEGHHICDHCSGVLLRPFPIASTSTAPPESPVVRSSTSTSSIPGDHCCAPENLSKGLTKLMENLLRESTWECKFKGLGCRESVTGSLWKSHIANCAFDQSCLCMYAGCKETIQLQSELVEHYMSKHALRPLQGPTVIIEVPFKILREGRVIHLIKSHECYFLFATEICDKDDTVHSWVVGLQALNYKYKIEVARVASEEERDNPSYALLSGWVLPYQLEPEAVFTHSECANIPLKTFESTFLSYPTDQTRRVWSIKLSLIERP